MFQSKSGKTPPPQIVALRQRLRDMRVQQVARAISNLNMPMAVAGLSDEDRVSLATIRTQGRVHINN